jgi:transposase-like protein
MAATSKKPVKKKKPNPATPKKPADGFNPEVLKLVEGMARMGATETELAQAMGIHRVTLYRWKVEFPDLARAIDEGGQTADQRVEKALYNRACGYDVRVTKLLVVQGRIESREVIEHHPPDPTAGIFWLANRQGHRWQRNPVPKDAVHVDMDDGAPQMSRSELARRLMYVLRQNAKVKEKERIALSSAPASGADATSNEEA